MIVVDASAVVEALVGREVDPTLLDAMAGDLAAPRHVVRSVVPRTDTLIAPVWPSPRRVREPLL